MAAKNLRLYTFATTLATIHNLLPLTATRPTLAVGKETFAPKTDFSFFCFCSHSPHSILINMAEATLIYPHQLFTTHPALAPGRKVFLIEEPLFLNEFPVHTQKLLLHRLSMQAYRADLEAQGYSVSYLEIKTLSDTASVFLHLAAVGYNVLHIVDTTDYWLEKRIQTAATTHDLTLVRYESPLFILTKEEAISLYCDSKKHHATFYKKMRAQKNILLDEEGAPTGGRWSYDSENQKKLPKNITLPSDICYTDSTDIKEALSWLTSFSSEHYGKISIWLPHTRTGALVYLETFLTERLKDFGAYEDALTTTHTRLFHSTLSPLLNIGLLSPMEVIEAALKIANTSDVPLSSLEGFIRQILGWREFIRASYECDGAKMRTQNFWQHTRSLPATFWDASTGLLPLDTSIKRALEYGYNHHIERLMVLGNFMLLSETHPDEVYRWFMAMYVDAYDWVMVPNVYGMSQFADGGSFATKPYISGSNYLRKMSDYASGPWEELWTSLYWNFINTHADFFSRNHRLSMMPRLLEKMDKDKRNQYLQRAALYLTPHK